MEPKLNIKEINKVVTTVSKNGFELAEADLKQRGSGDLSGKKQWGISDIGMLAIQNIKMVEASREEAKIIVETDPTLLKLPLLKDMLNKNKNKIHFE